MLGIGATTGPLIMAGFLSGNAAWRYGYLAVSVVQFTLATWLAVTLRLWNHQEEQVKKLSSASQVARSETPPATENGETNIAIGVMYALAAFLLYCGIELTR